MSERESPQNEQSEQFDQKLVHKVSKTVLHAAERGKQSLFETLTAKNADKLAKIMQGKPLFYEHDQTKPTSIMLDEEISGILPQDFFQDPTKWIEQQKGVSRGDEAELPAGETIGELWGMPYDVTKVKEFSLRLPDGQVREIVSKRIEKDQLEEIAIARKAYEAGIPTPKVLGEIIDKGNIYVFFEKISGINLNAAWWRLYRRQYPLMVQQYGTFRYATNEKDFDRSMQELSKISTECKNDIFKLWRKYKDIIRKKRIFYLLGEIAKDALDKCTRANISLEQFSSEDISECLSDLGYKSIGELRREYIRKTPEFFKDMSDEALDDMIRSFDKGTIPTDYIKSLNEYREFSTEDIDEKEKELEQILMDKFDRKLRALVYTDIFGFDYPNEMKKIKQQCKDTGIEHKDFENRNFLMRWDFEKDLPLKNLPEGQPKLYIIDWERAKRKSLEAKNGE